MHSLILEKQNSYIPLIHSDSIPLVLNSFNTQFDNLDMFRVPSIYINSPFVEEENKSIFTLKEEELFPTLSLFKANSRQMNPLVKQSSTSEHILSNLKEDELKTPSISFALNQEKDFNNLICEETSFSIPVRNRLITTYSYDFGFKFSSKKNKVSKKIGKVIEKVCEWRRLSHNFEKFHSNTSKEDAAKRIGMKKKSLDDYLMYLRLGIALCFDFQLNINNKFGNLRKYISEYRKGNKWNKDRHQDVESLLTYVS